MSITIGVQSPNGTKRVTINSSDSTADLYQAIQDEFKLTSQLFTLSRDRQKNQPITKSKSESVDASGVKHGDRIFLHPSSDQLFPREDLYYKPKTSAKPRDNNGGIHTLPPGQQGGG